MANVTALVPRSKQLLTALYGLVALLLVLSGLWTWRAQNSCKLQLQYGCYSLEYARTTDELKQGLSDRDGLPTNHGMLFVIPKSNPACFWMKDMHFNLDIVWTDSSKKITKIEPNLSPDTYPQDYCSAGTAYVLEIEAGQAAYNQLRVGQQLSF